MHTHAQPPPENGIDKDFFFEPFINKPLQSNIIRFFSSNLQPPTPALSFNTRRKLYYAGRHFDDYTSTHHTSPYFTKPILRSSKQNPPITIPPLRNVHCTDQKFRAINGFCTTVRNQLFGLARLPQFSYITSLSTEQFGGQGLDNVRTISNILSKQTTSVPNKQRLNDLFVTFGQFIDHNLVASPEKKKNHREKGDVITFPNRDGQQITLVRTVTTKTRGITRPVNCLSSTLDLSAVYGANNLRNNFLVENKRGNLTGRLLTSAGNLLPRNPEGDKAFTNSPGIKKGTNDYFLAGDHRVNEHPVLTSLHTIFLREHNRLVKVIRRKLGYPENLNGRQGARLYQFARLVNILQFQKIVYEEFYPAIIRRELPQYTGARSNVNPDVSVIFSGAAFRVGHTMVSDDVAIKNRTGFEKPITRKNIFFRRASDFTSRLLNKVIRGAARRRCQEVDLLVVDLLRNFLFKDIEGEDGLDLVALNLARGRDFNLPSFKEVREKICNLPPVRSFSDITSDKRQAAALKKAYKRADKVEAFPGLIAEDQETGSGMGKTMNCIWRREFTRLRDADQYFYKRTEKIPLVLRRKLAGLLAEVDNPRKAIFRRIIVDNTEIRNSELPTGSIFRLGV